MADSKNQLAQSDPTAYTQGYQDGYRAGYERAIADFQSGGPGRYDADILLLPLEALGLSARARNCLIRYHCHCIGDAARLSGETIRIMHNLGPITADEIARALHRTGIKFTEWDKFLLE